MTNIKLTKPAVIDGKEVNELNFDLDNLTGQHLIDATTEARAMGDRSPVLELSKTYQAVVAAKALSIPVDTLINLPAKDFSKITMEVAGFLLE